MLSPSDAARRVALSLAASRPLRVLGADGPLRGLVLARVAAEAPPDTPILYVAADDRAARTVAADAAFFAGLPAPSGSLETDGPILVLPEPDTSPWADVSPDPRVVGARLGALARLADLGGESPGEAGDDSSDDSLGPTVTPFASVPSPVGPPSLDSWAHGPEAFDPDATARGEPRPEPVATAGASPPRIVVASIRALMRKAMPRAAFVARCRRWSMGEELDRGEATEDLVAAGYARTEVVEDPGTFAVRGGVMDLWVPRERFPVRLEWFGDEIERMRRFDPDSQRSLGPVESLAVHPVRETVRTRRGDPKADVLALADAAEVPSSKTRTVLDNLGRGLDFFGLEALVPVLHDSMDPVWRYLPPSTRWLVDEPALLTELAERIEEEARADHARAIDAKHLVAAPEAFMVQAQSLSRMLADRPIVLGRLETERALADDARPPLRIESGGAAGLAARLAAARGRKGEEILRPVVDHVRTLVDADPPWSVLLAAPNLTHAERLTSLLRGYGLTMHAPRGATDAPVSTVAPPDGTTTVQVIAGELSAGYASKEDRVLLLSEADLFGRITRRAKARRRKAAGLGNLAQLGVGDYVVHVVHGVGRYSGLSKLSIKGVPGDYVLIEYQGADRLYLPVHRVAEIERYVSAEAKAPRLDKMGGATFDTKKRKVRGEVEQMAEELLQLYAQREALQGHAYAEPDDLYASFEATFPFEETADQADAIEAVGKDLTSARPMDRLICGDVGFGKTEVALRAAFRVALAGKQVAVLAPTTVLVQQHFHTFRERMSRFGVRVEHLGRFASPARRRKVVAAAKEGTVDVVVGTHRLLSRDVRFADLGLVVIDEEQRFGVKQKERFKKLKTQVDMLALSATPIPRTLHMSLVGLREISLIMTPPVDRLAVRTVVTRNSDPVLEDGIRRELARGGQVFYVVPKILGIEEHAVRIRRLVPEAKVLVAHGRMPPEMLERAMVDFVEHKADVLVSTTIIESGLDIPRANTMFIDRADMFGLSQIYQLRGRVGRSKHRAHCFLMVRSLERLSPEAKRRLEAVQRHAELGSGFQVASEDLEIRGAGEILGGRQTGHIAAVGFEAYSRILSEAVGELRGEPIVHETDPELAFDVPAFLPDTYVEDTGQRLDLYRRLSAAHDVDVVQGVMEEIRDRFGELPREATNLAAMMACKTYGRRLEAVSVELNVDRLTLRLSDRTPLEAKLAATLARKTDGRLALQSGDRIVAKLPPLSGQDRTRQLEAAQAALAELVTYAHER